MKGTYKSAYDIIRHNTSRTVPGAAFSATFRAMAGQLLGAGYERLTRTLPLCLVVYWGLHMTGFQIQVASGVRYLMVGTLSAGIMWQALSSESGGACMKNLWMLPVRSQVLVFSYVGALGAYTFCTKTAWLLAVLAGVCPGSRGEFLGSLLCGVCAILATAAVYVSRHRWIWGGCVAGMAGAVIVRLGDTWAYGPVMLGCTLSFLLLLGCTDAYAFYPQAGGKRHRIRTSGHHCLQRYLWRYLTAHKNYLYNTLALWGVACVLPLLFGEVDGRFALPVGYAILSLNTPLGILLSCDRALGRAVGMLPGQGKRFYVPYGCFLCGCHMVANVIFLFSWLLKTGGMWIQAGAVGMPGSADVSLCGFLGLALAGSVLFALGSALGNVLLERFFPIRGWKVESDLWHHPRKYMVPGCLLLLAGLLSGMLLTL